MGGQFISVLDRPKIFVIGLEHTGSSSLGRALENFGYSTTSQNGPIDRPRIVRAYRRICVDTSYNFDAFHGNPWPLAFREMYQLWPNARFILTTRDSREWFDAMVESFGGTDTPIRRLIYGHGDPEGHEDQYIDKLLSHEEDVRTFFGGDTSSLLIKDFASGDDCEQLRDFLGSVPLSDGAGQNGQS